MKSGTKEITFNKTLFGEDFDWGVSTAAFQVEGSCDVAGKGESIWDNFTAKKGKILNGENATTACDFYNQFKIDIDLIKQLNIPNFRFSISWTRIIPDGTGPVNQAGIDYYDQVIDYCLEKGVEPWITLYHWDLPQALENKGGWTNRDVIEWFTRFVTVCAENFGHKVKHWMVMNEPAVFTGAGYFLGIHAPGRTGLKNFLPAIHHVVLSIVSGAKTLRKLLPPETQIGTTFSCSFIEPYSDKKRDINAAIRADALINRLFIEPLLGMGYPVKEMPVLKGIDKYFKDGDAANMQFDFDFIGIQNYTREIVKYSLFTPYVNATLVKAENRNVKLTEMKWEVYPNAIYQMIKKFSSYEKVKKLYITENGAAFKDNVVNNAIDDRDRIAYLKDNLEEVLTAKEDGYKINGYFVWTLTDNFEWAEGYHPRFGLIHINFNTLKRTVKNSGWWYANFLK